MRYIETGSKVYYRRQVAKVVGEGRINKRAVSVLELEGKRRLSVPLVDIMWNGNSFIVKPDGVKFAENVEAAEKGLQELRDDIKKWDAENPRPIGLDREKCIYACFMDWLRAAAETYGDNELGGITRHVLKGLEEL